MSLETQPQSSNPNYRAENVFGSDINHIFASEMALYGAISHLAKYAKDDGIEPMYAFLRSENLTPEELLSNVATAMIADSIHQMTKGRADAVTTNFLTREADLNRNNMGEITEQALRRTTHLAETFDFTPLTDDQIKACFTKVGCMLYEKEAQDALRKNSAALSTPKQVEATSRTETAASMGAQGPSVRAIARGVRKSLRSAINAAATTESPQTVTGRADSTVVTPKGLENAGAGVFRRAKSAQPLITGRA